MPSSLIRASAPMGGSPASGTGGKGSGGRSPRRLQPGRCVTESSSTLTKKNAGPSESARHTTASTSSGCPWGGGSAAGIAAHGELLLELTFAPMGLRLTVLRSKRRPPASTVTGHATLDRGCLRRSAICSLIIRVSSRLAWASAPARRSALSSQIDVLSEPSDWPSRPCGRIRDAPQPVMTQPVIPSPPPRFVLLRDRPSADFETLLIQRHPKSKFAAGTTSSPGQYRGGRRAVGRRALLREPTAEAAAARLAVSRRARRLATGSAPCEAFEVGACSSPTRSRAGRSSSTPPIASGSPPTAPHANLRRRLSRHAARRAPHPRH